MVGPHNDDPVFLAIIKMLIDALRQRKGSVIHTPKNECLLFAAEDIGFEHHLESSDDVEPEMLNHEYQSDERCCKMND